MIYRELWDKLADMTDAELDSDIVVYDEGDDLYFYGVNLGPAPDQPLALLLTSDKVWDMI